MIELWNQLNNEVAAGRVIRVDHETLDLSLFTYSRDCMFDRSWNITNMLARGLIMKKPFFYESHEYASVIAKPFPKFFNYGEVSLTLPDLPFTVSTKEDGSLGIVYYYDGKWRVATKGSFKSEQAQWAEEYLYANVDVDSLDRSLTYLVEIIYAENRIVIKYDEDKLVLTGAYEWLTGNEIFPPPHVPGLEPVGLHEFSSVDDILVLAKSLPGSKEGFVVRFSNGYRVKIKGDEYIKLHKMMSDFTPLRIWEVVRDCINLDAYAKDLPEEFRDEFYRYAKLFNDEFGYLHMDVLFADLTHNDKTDKELGLWIKQEREAGREKPEHAFLFLARKKNWLKESLSDPKARKSAFDLFRPKGNTAITRLNVKESNDEQEKK